MKVWQARKQRWIPDIGCADSGMTGEELRRFRDDGGGAAPIPG
jgi:hypothetical protein